MENKENVKESLKEKCIPVLQNQDRVLGLPDINVQFAVVQSLMTHHLRSVIAQSVVAIKNIVMTICLRMNIDRARYIESDYGASDCARNE